MSYKDESECKFEELNKEKLEAIFNCDKYQKRINELQQESTKLWDLLLPLKKVYDSIEWKHCEDDKTSQV